jgi:hypothetical protein
MIKSEWIFDSFLVHIFQIHVDWWLPEIKTRERWKNSNYCEMYITVIFLLR